MKLAWGRATALIVAATVTFGAGACGSSTSGEKPAAATATSSKAPEPKETLLASLAAYDKGVYTMDFAALDGTGTGAIDAVQKHVYLKMLSTDPAAAFSMEFLVLEPDAYVKMNMGEMSKLPGMQLLAGKTWMHVDRSKLTAQDLSLKADEVDLLGIKAMLTSAQSVQSTGGGKYTGTLDLAKGADAPMTDEDVVKALGDKAAAVPFTATVDAEGRLSELLIDVPAAGENKAHQLKLAVRDYGTATMPAKPTGNAVVEAPANMYEMLNG